MVVRSMFMRAVVRDRAAGVLCCAHVPRSRPVAETSSFTSLRRAPHRPDLAPPEVRDDDVPRALGSRHAPHAKGSR